MLVKDSFQKKWVLSLFSKHISKGELIQKIEPDQWTVAYSEPPIFVNCQEDQLKFVDPVFVPYLLAIENLSSRYNLFINELHSLSNNILLNVGDKVEVMMEQQRIPTSGIVKYKGNLLGKIGIFFGIEIVVSHYYIT